MSDEPPAHVPPPEKYFSVFGFVIVRKADLLAATAFLLALASTLYQLFGFLSGPHVDLFAPDRVVIFFDSYSDNQTVTRIAGQLTFTNSGQAGRNATVRNVVAKLTVGKNSFQQVWISFGHVERDGKDMKFNADDDAYPLEVPGSGAVSKMTGFAPEDRNCSNCQVQADYVSKIDFLKLLGQNRGGTVTLSFSAHTFQHRKIVPSVCEIQITQGLIAYLAVNDWYIAHCRPVHGTA